MNNCVNTIGFIFNCAKVYIKNDKNKKYSKNSCQECGYKKKHCNKCNNNENYQICIFKLKKDQLVSSTLGIVINENELWNDFKKNVVNLINGNFVISVTKKSKLHSFYANLCKVKMCDCCDVINLYFKYNVISDLECYNYCNNDQFKIYPDNYWTDDNNYQQICANKKSNITYNLKTESYSNIKFYYNNLYTYNPIY